MKKIFVKHHLGLGDSIAHNGMIRKIFEDNEPCEIYCSAKPNFHHNISFMYRDNPNIKVLKMDDNETNRHLENFKYDQVISSHFDSGSDFSYEKFGDDAFYLKVGMDPNIKRTHFYIERDYNREMELFKKLTSDIGSEDYIFVHEKSNENIFVSREKINSSLPIISPTFEHKIFDLLTVVERAKEVHVISSCFLSFFMSKKFNEKTYAHMYADIGRTCMSEMVKNNGIDVIL